MTEIFVGDTGNTQSNVMQGSLWLVSRERMCYGGLDYILQGSVRSTNDMTFEVSLTNGLCQATLKSRDWCSSGSCRVGINLPVPPAKSREIKLGK